MFFVRLKNSTTAHVFDTAHKVAIFMLAKDVTMYEIYHSDNKLSKIEPEFHLLEKQVKELAG